VVHIYRSSQQFIFNYFAPSLHCQFVTEMSAAVIETDHLLGDEDPPQPPAAATATHDAAMVKDGRATRTDHVNVDPDLVDAAGGSTSASSSVSKSTDDEAAADGGDAPAPPDDAQLLLRRQRTWHRVFSNATRLIPMLATISTVTATITATATLALAARFADRRDTPSTLSGPV
jgi:hypothetical protein